MVSVNADLFIMEGELRWYGKNLGDFDQIRLVPISDLHYGNPLCSIKHFLMTVNFIRDNDDVFTFLNGDLAEAIMRDSVGDIYGQKFTPQKQRDDVIELLLPIKDKILGSVIGNHEERIYHRCGIDIASDISSALGVPYRSEGMLLKVIFGHGNSRVADKPFVFWGYTTHGYGGARTKSAKAVKAERASTWVPRADFIAMSHDHIVNIAPDVDLIPDNRGTLEDSGFLTGKVTAHRKMLIKTNAYLKWGGYSERLGFPPTDMATPVVMLLSPKSEYWNLVPEKPKNAVKVVA